MLQNLLSIVLRNSRFIIGLLLGLTLASIFYRVMNQPLRYFCRYVLEDASAQMGPREPLAVDAITAKFEPVYKRLKSIGTIRAANVVTLKSSLNSGVIKAIHFKEGDQVKKGDILIEFDDEEAKAKLQEQQARLELAEDKYKRLKNLASKGAETASKAKEAEKEYDMAKGLLEQAKANFDKHTLRAVFSGTIGIVEDATVGSLVKFDKDLVTLTDDSKMNLEVKFPAKNIDEIGIGQTVYFKVESYPNKKFEGEVVAIDSKVNIDSHTILIKAEVNNEAKLLKHGMLGESQLVTAHKEKAFLVPESAITSAYGTDVMFIINPRNKRVFNVPVIKDFAVGSRRVIESGLKEGDIYVSTLRPNLTQGSIVEIKSLDSQEYKGK